MINPPHDHDDLDEDASMPVDPDRADVPADLLKFDGQLVSMTHDDGTVETGVLVVAPELWGHARRFSEGFYKPDDAT